MKINNEKLEITAYRLNVIQNIFLTSEAKYTRLEFYCEIELFLEMKNPDEFLEDITTRKDFAFITNDKVFKCFVKARGGKFYEKFGLYFEIGFHKRYVKNFREANKLIITKYIEKNLFLEIALEKIGKIVNIETK